MDGQARQQADASSVEHALCGHAGQTVSEVGCASAFTLTFSSAGVQPCSKATQESAEDAAGVNNP
jgi:hypothetical protein